MDFDKLNELIQKVSSNPDVQDLVKQIEQIVSGKEPRVLLLAFLPILAKIIYDILDKDGKDAAYFNMGEQMLELLVRAIEKKQIAA